MTSKLKCPMCGHKLALETEHEDKLLETMYCPTCKHFMLGNYRIWQALIQAKQDLEQYERKDNLQQQLNANNNQIQENYKQIVQIDEQIIENLEKDLQTAVQALREIRYCKSAGFDLPAQTPWEILADKALEQIEHKE